MLETYTPTLAKLKIGPFLRDLTEHMLSPKSQLKIKVFSAHDTTISSLLNGLNLKSFAMPPYASNLIFEIYASNFEIIIFHPFTSYTIYISKHV